MVKIDIKPLSVNECWQGTRYKTARYRKYENDVLFLLPKVELPAAPYKIYFEFGMSNVASDFDNPVKPTLDIMQKKYGFNDKNIFEAHIVKIKVDKGKEYFKFQIKSLNQ